MPAKPTAEQPRRRDFRTTLYGKQLSAFEAWMRRNMVARPSDAVRQLVVAGLMADARKEST